MGISTNIKAFISPEDPTYKKHARILNMCIQEDVSMPKETIEYFGSYQAEKYLLEEKLEIEIPFYEYVSDNENGFEIFVKDIPIGTHKIRFYNGW